MTRDGVFSRRMRPEMVHEGFHDLSPSDSHEVHVLAVDDSLVDRTVIERLLKISSCKVTAVDSGRRALQILGLDDEMSSVTSVGVDAMKLKVDLIITDYCMPGMTGYELLKKIKGSSTFREIPVVIMSSENVLTRIDRCLEEGAEDFLLKPVKLSDVKRLKGYMFGEDRAETQHGGINKRKSPEPYVSPSPSPSEQSITPSLSPSSSPHSSTSPSPSPSSPDSPLPHSSSRSLPCPPTSLDSPTRRLRMTNSD